jgi:hypothetical protein
MEIGTLTENYSNLYHGQEYKLKSKDQTSLYEPWNTSPAFVIARNQ